MDDKTLTKLLKQGFSKQDARIKQGFAEQDTRIKQGFAEQDTRFGAILTQALADQSRDLRDYTDQRVTSLEKRMDAKFDGQKQEIIDAMAETMDFFIHPRINDHERRLLKLEAKTT